MIVNGICTKTDFKSSEVLVNGLRVVKFDEREGEDGMMSFKETTVEDSVDGVRNLLLELITEYDTSPNVNSFAIVYGGKEYSYWLPAEKRGQLVTGVAARKACGGSTYTLDLREYGVSIDIDCDKLSELLSKLENYAVESYNATSKHRNKVEKLNDIDSLLAYDYKVGYPEKLTFNL